MVTITVHQDAGARQVQIPEGASLLSALQQTDASVPAPCGGNHTCGKCFVRAEGRLSPITDHEAALLKGQEPGIRLACFAAALGDCAIHVAGHRQNTLTDFAAGPGAGSPLFAPGKYGFAVDIGTTTIAAYLYGSDQSQPLGVLGEYNRQQQFGADVMARISHANEHTAEPLRRTVTDQLGDLFARLCGTCGVAPADVTDAVITGNTVMLHLLAGLEVRTLALYPFTPVTHFGAVTPLDIPGFSHLRCYLPRCISAYVGADITCGMLACDLAQQPGNVLFADIGTNGEMVLKTEDKLLCCSTAAGPAFEGAGLSWGCGAVGGAINAVHLSDGQLTCDTLDAKPPTGICGSGVVDAIAAFLQLGRINAKGKIAKEHGKALAFPDTAVGLSQMDIRQVQLAKGAIRAGMDCMMQEAGLSYDALDQIILCGGFGSFIRPAAAQAIGMLPPGGAEKTRAAGNAAGQGASMLLLNRDAAAALDALAVRTQCIELSSDPRFATLFVTCMNF